MSFFATLHLSLPSIQLFLLLIDQNFPLQIDLQFNNSGLCESKFKQENDS